jgi:hypothetical protein
MDAAVMLGDRIRCGAGPQRAPDHPDRMMVAPERRGSVVGEMSHYLAPPPARRADYGSLGQLMGWMVLLGLAFWPRLFILGFWIFDRQIGGAFGSWIIPAIGFVVLPWTTLAYALIWGVGSDVVSGWEWIVVAAAFLVDVGFWVESRRLLRG